MKFTTVLSTSAIVAAAAAAPSSSTTYNIRVNAINNNPAINNTLLAVKDESATTAPNAIGVWSTGEPRSAYSLTISPNPANNKVFEMKGSVKQTHLILLGPDAAMPLYDVPIGADPKPAVNQTLITNAFTLFPDTNRLLQAQRYKPGGDPNDLVGSGSWRACKGDSTVDYLILWFDGKLLFPPASTRESTNHV
jgi:hypothetical protein